MPSLAWHALEAGFDGRALRRLAALNKPNWSEVQHLLPRVRAELGMKVIATEEASYRVAKQRAQEILESGKDPLLRTRAFELLWIKAGYAARLAVLGCRDDEVNVARCVGSPGTEIRLQVTKALTEFAPGRTAQGLLVV
jgi:hypothetical protein